MIATELMEFFAKYWVIIVSLTGIIWHLIRQYFDYQNTKEKLTSFEKTTSEYISTFEKKNLDKYEALEMQVRNHRKELEREIELAKQKAEKDMLKAKDETMQRMDKLFEKIDILIQSNTELKTGFFYIKEAIDDLKGK